MSPFRADTVISIPNQLTSCQSPGKGQHDSPCAVNSCTAETIRAMIDDYSALGEVRVKSTAQRPVKEEGKGGNTGGFGTEERGVMAMEAGLPRLNQVCPFPVEVEVALEGNLMHPSCGVDTTDCPVVCPRLCGLVGGNSQVY